jgi:hypothetical protein
MLMRATQLTLAASAGGARSTELAHVAVPESGIYWNINAVDRGVVSSSPIVWIQQRSAADRNSRRSDAGLQASHAAFI